jgi:hypothetical protein
MKTIISISGEGIRAEGQKTKLKLFVVHSHIVKIL